MNDITKMNEVQKGEFKTAIMDSGGATVEMLASGAGVKADGSVGALADQMALLSDRATYNLRPMRAAIDRGPSQPLRVVYMGDSILENNNQNSRYAGLPYIIARRFREAFPEASVEFVNMALGGRLAWQMISPTYVGAANDSSPSTGYFRTPNSGLTYYGTWRTEDGTTLNGSTLGEAWIDAVKRLRPDVIITEMQLNETPGVNPCFGATGYYRSMKAWIEAIQAWPKRPTIILGTTHTGLPNTQGRTDDLAGRPLMLTVGRIARALTKQYALPLFDGQRQYEILTRGVDITNPEPHVEAGLRYNGGFNSTSTFTLDPDYWATLASDNTTGISPDGTTFRGVASNVWHVFRKRTTADCHIQVSFTALTLNPRPEVYYRINPTSAEALSGDKYLIRINGANIELASYDTLTNGSGNLLRVIASAPLDTAVAQFQTYYLDIEVTGARHIVRVNGKLKLDVIDFTHMRVGWVGFGQGANSQNCSIKVGTNFQDGTFIEFFDDKVVNSSPLYTDEDLLGANNDWIANPSSDGGNTFHLTTKSYGLVFDEEAKALWHTIRETMGGVKGGQQ